MSQATYQATSYSSIICRPNSLNKNIQQTKQRHFYAPAYIIDAVRLLKCCKEFIRVGEEVYIVITILIVKMVVAEFIQAWWMQMQPDWKSSSTTNFNWNLNSCIELFFNIPAEMIFISNNSWGLESRKGPFKIGFK